MTDDLVKRLHQSADEAARQKMVGDAAHMREAANRIEALEAEVKRLQGEVASLRKRVRGDWEVNDENDIECLWDDDHMGEGFAYRATEGSK